MRYFFKGNKFNDQTSADRPALLKLLKTGLSLKIWEILLLYNNYLHFLKEKSRLKCG